MGECILDIRSGKEFVEWHLDIARTSDRKIDEYVLDAILEQQGNAVSGANPQLRESPGDAPRMLIKFCIGEIGGGGLDGDPRRVPPKGAAKQDA